MEVDLTFDNGLSLPFEHVAEVMTRCFEGYQVPVVMNPIGLQYMVRIDSVYLESSLIAKSADQPAGIGLIARRGDICRVAAMAIAPEFRAQGVGKALMRRLMDDARGRGEREMRLEVIEGNDPAVRLYEGLGFKHHGKLLGYRTTNLMSEAGDLLSSSPAEVALQMRLHGVPDLPWQLAPETVALCALPHRAYRLGAAWIVITDPSQDVVTVRGMVVERDQRRRGHGRRLLAALAAKYPGKTWRVIPVVPEEVPEAFFTSCGFETDSLSQFRMRCPL